LIEPAPSYDRKNEYENRNKIEAELAQKYDKRANIVVPYGKTLSFAGVEGQLITFGYSTAGGFLINGVGASSSLIFTVSSFIVSNGVSNENPFEVSGGIVKIKTANVGVLTAANISVANLAAINADLGTVTAGQLNLTAGSYVVRHGAGFGTSSDLVMWYGLSSVAIGSATKTNGVFALATDGKVYYGGSELASAAESFDAYISAETNGVFVTAPDTAVVNATVSASGGTPSYSYAWALISAADGFTPSGTTTATLSLSQAYVLGSQSNTETWRCTVMDDEGRTLFVTVIFVAGSL